MRGATSTGALVGFAALLAVAAAWPWLVTADPVVMGAAPGVAAPVAPPANDPQALATVLERPLFSPGRRPAMPDGAGAATIAARPAFRVEGVVDAGGRRRAILRRDGGDVSLHLAEGESVDGWVVRAISPDRVVLVSPAGELVLPAR
jgi:hypothetical protein